MADEQSFINKLRSVKQFLAGFDDDRVKLDILHYADLLLLFKDDKPEIDSELAEYKKTFEQILISLENEQSAFFDDLVDDLTTDEVKEYLRTVVLPYFSQKMNLDGGRRRSGRKQRKTGVSKRVRNQGNQKSKKSRKSRKSRKNYYLHNAY